MGWCDVTVPDPLIEVVVVGQAIVLQVIDIYKGIIILVINMIEGLIRFQVLKSILLV